MGDVTGHRRISVGPETHAAIDMLIRLREGKMHGTFKLKPGISPASGISINTLTHHTMLLSRAVLVGAKAGLDVELIPQIRLSMECAVTAAWLYASDPEAGDAFVHEGARQRRNVLADVVKVFPSNEVEPGLSQASATLELLEGSPGGKHFEQRCKQLVGGDELYLMYRTASAYSHAGLGISDHYAEKAPVSDADPLGVKVRLNAPLETIEEWIGIQLSMLILAMAAEDHARETPRIKTQIERAAKQIGMNFDLSLAKPSPAES